MDTYDALSGKGAVLPAPLNSTNLSRTVDSIPDISTKMDLTIPLEELSELQAVPINQLFTFRGEVYLKISNDLTLSAQKILSNSGAAVQLVPDFADSISECIDTEKLYVLPDGFIYAYMYGTAEPTNLLVTNQIYLNKRKNSGHNITAANGYITTDLIPVKEDDILRFSSASLLNGTYCRLKFFDSAGNRVILGGDDWNLNKEFKIETDSSGTPYIIVGRYNSTMGDDATNQKSSNAGQIASCYMNLMLSSSEIADIGDTVVTNNEPMDGGSEYSWRNTGHAFVPADYESRINDLEAASSAHDDAIALLNDRMDNREDAVLNSFSAGQITAPSPQSPADSSAEADFDADNINAEDIYHALDSLCEEFPDCITRETLGKDASGQYDWNRYVFCRHYYSAWQKADHPALYAWKNQNTIIFSESVSPRIGDTLYSTDYSAIAYGVVSAVDNAAQTRTLNGLVFERCKASDVAPTLVYTSILDEDANAAVYSERKTVITHVAEKSSSSFIGADGNTYFRCPMGDRDSKMEHEKTIVIGANEHGYPGDPRDPAIITARLLNDLCRGNNENHFISYLMDHYMIVVCPIVNPWGFSASSGGYVNYHNVNINRNYDTPGWGNLYDAGGQGEYGGSEIETQYFMNTISSSHAAVAVSYHALGYSGSSESTAGYVCHYQYNGIAEDADQLASIAELMKSKYGLKFTSYGEANPLIVAKSPAYITFAGAKGGIIEMQPCEREKNGNASYHTSRMMEANYTLMLNTLYLFLSDTE